MTRGGSLVRFLVLACLAWAALLATGREAWAQDGAGDEPAAARVPEERASPSMLYDTFFKSFNTATKRVDRERDPDAYRAAMLACVRCLVAEDIEPGTEDDAIRRLTPAATALKSVLDAQGRIDVDALPGRTYEGDRHALPLRELDGSIVVLRGPRGWHFSPGTVESAPTWDARYDELDIDRYEFRTLRDSMPPALRGKALFLEHWQWLGIVVLIVIAIIVDRIVVFVARGIVARVLQRTKVLASAANVAQLSGRPFGLLAMAAVLWLLHPPLDLDPRPFVMAAKIVASIGAILLLFRVVDVFAARMMEAAEQTESKLDDQLVPLLRKSLKVVIFVGGVLFILDNLEMDIMSLLAGVSVAGLAVSFAAKDTVANLFGSVTVFLDKPFQVGDWILTNGVEGTVEEVGFRTTRVRTFYNSRVSLPNSLLVTGVVDNMGERVYRRFKTLIGVQYDTPPERIEAFCAGIRKIVQANELMRQDVAMIHLNGFGASSLDILVYVFFQVPDWAAELRERQNFIVEILRLARELGVEFAFPTQTLHVASTPERPLTEPEALTEEEMWSIVAGFGKGGEMSRPGGSPRFLPTPPTPPKNADPDRPEVRGS